MRLKVHFTCQVNVHEFEKNYSGRIEFSPEGGRTQIYHFLFLNPYGGKEAELGIYEDSEKKKVFVEAVGEPTLGFNQHTGRAVTYFDFNLGEDAEKTGVAFVVCNIIAEAIYQTDTEWRNKSEKMKAGEFPRSQFARTWVQDFAGRTEKFARGFLKAFGL